MLDYCGNAEDLEIHWNWKKSLRYFAKILYILSGDGGHSFSTYTPKRVGGQALCVCQCTVASDVIICAYKVIDCV